MRYHAKPLEIEAVLWTGKPNCIPSAWHDEALLEQDHSDLVIPTLEGPTRAKAGQHYLVRGTVGEFYPVRRDIFEAKYTAVSDE